jgi:phosphoenolpyruvate carboxykinase (diphosphate)
VAAVLPGRRNNPPETGIRSLACYNPIHYMELPELFMEFICSMTGKSPSTTGAGSEGALTKGPFNALPPIIDLNNALVRSSSPAITRSSPPPATSDRRCAWTTTSACCAGSLVPHGAGGTRSEISDRQPFSKNARTLSITAKKVLASRLGYRINARFVRNFFGRVFNHPHAVFTEEMLKPGIAGPGHFCGRHGQHRHHPEARGQNVFRRRQHAQACPPLKALLHIMLNDRGRAKGSDDPEFRKMFTREWRRNCWPCGVSGMPRGWRRSRRLTETLHQLGAGPAVQLPGAPGF